MEPEEVTARFRIGPFHYQANGKRPGPARSSAQNAGKIHQTLENAGVTFIDENANELGIRLRGGRET